MSAVMTFVAWQALLPLAIVSLGTGVLLGMGTHWGVTKHWWLLTKAVLSLALTAGAVTLLIPQLPYILAGGNEPIDPVGVAARAVALVALLAATALSVAKPWGRIRRPHVRVRDTPGTNGSAPLQRAERW
jgi:hypothetical protein